MENIAIIIGLFLAIPLWFLFHKLFIRVYVGNVFFKIIGEILGAWFVGYLIAGLILSPFAKLFSKTPADNLKDIDLSSIGGIYCISNAEHLEQENYYITVYNIYENDTELVYDSYRYSIGETYHVGNTAYTQAILEKSSGVMEYEGENNVFYSVDADGREICLVSETNELSYDLFCVSTPIQPNLHNSLSEEDVLFIMESTASEYNRKFLQPETDEAFQERLKKANTEHESALVAQAVQLQKELYNHYANYGIYLPEDLHPAEYYDYVLKYINNYDITFESIDDQYLMFEIASKIWDSYGEYVTDYVRNSSYPFETSVPNDSSDQADFDIPTDEEGWASWAEHMMVEYDLPRNSDSPLDTMFYYLAAEGTGELSLAEDEGVAQLKSDHPEYDTFMLWVEVNI